MGINNYGSGTAVETNSGTMNITFNGEDNSSLNKELIKAINDLYETYKNAKPNEKQNLEIIKEAEETAAKKEKPASWKIVL
jgi:hypothetical protein